MRGGEDTAVGKCDFCHEETGLLGRDHPDCRTAGKRISELVRQSALNATGVEGFPARYEEARTAQGRKVVALGPVLAGWGQAIDGVLEDGVLSSDEEGRLVAIAKATGIDQANAGSLWTRLVKAAVLRDVMEGKVPERVAVEGHHANLMKAERPVWLFNGVRYYEERTYRSFKGVSHGLSIRIAKGVYYRPSAFRGSPVETTKLVQVDSGQVLVTSHHIYFLGTRKRLRVPYRKIVSVEPFKDGIGIQRDAMTARPQIFILDDAWFAYNLVSNLGRISEESR
jgi:hypothetical protein